jgi:hypothetical protein
MAFSLLAHSIVFLFFSLYLQFQPAVPNKNKAEPLNVRLVQPSPQQIQVKPSQQLLSTPAPAQFVISKVTAQTIRDIATTSAPDAERTYSQPGIEPQARQHSEIQVQLMIQQLQQMLTKRLNVIPLVSGKCVLVESNEGANNKLRCDSSALHEVLYKDQQKVAEMLITLRDMGRMLNGFSVEIRNEKPLVTMSYEITPSIIDN